MIYYITNHYAISTLLWDTSTVPDTSLVGPILHDGLSDVGCLRSVDRSYGQSNMHRSTHDEIVKNQIID